MLSSLSGSSGDCSFFIFKVLVRCLMTKPDCCVSFIALHPPHLQLHRTATQLTADLLKYHADHVVLKALKLTGVEGNLEGLAEYACKLSEQKEQLVEVSNRFVC